MAGVERDAVAVGDGRVKSGLHVVDGLGDEVEGELAVGVEVVEGCPGAVPVVGEFGVGAVAGDGKVLPGGDVGFGYVLGVGEG